MPEIQMLCRGSKKAGAWKPRPLTIAYLKEFVLRSGLYPAVDLLYEAISVLVLPLIGKSRL
jgi:hypothetical protein